MLGNHPWKARCLWAPYVNPFDQGQFAVETIKVGAPLTLAVDKTTARLSMAAPSLNALGAPIEKMGRFNSRGETYDIYPVAAGDRGKN